MFQTLIRKAQDRLSAIREADWRQKSDQFWDWVWNSLLSLDPPKDPNEVDAVLLEDRILYSATPFPFVGDGSAGEVPQDGVPQGFTPEAWEGVLASLEQFAYEHGYGQPPAGQTTSDADSVGLIGSVGSALGFTDDGSETEKPRREIVLIQEGLDNVESLLQDLQRQNASSNVEYQAFVLDDSLDGFAQIDRILSGLTNIDAIHIVSHGGDGAVQLGNGWLDGDSLGQRVEELHAWGMSLTEQGDILIYGCDVASGSFGC